MVDSKRKTVDLYRSSINGQIVTQKYAEKHLKTTEHERIKKK